MGTLIFILIVVLLIVSAFIIYKRSEVCALYKLRKSFMVKKEDIQKLLENRGSDLNFNYEYYQGELEEIDELIAIIDKNIQELKNFDFTD